MPPWSELGTPHHQAPLASMVIADSTAQAGEWVQQEDKVLRILRLDRLRAEGLCHFATCGTTRTALT